MAHPTDSTPAKHEYILHLAVDASQGRSIATATSEESEAARDILRRAGIRLPGKNEIAPAEMDSARDRSQDRRQTGKSPRKGRPRGQHPTSLADEWGALLEKLTEACALHSKVIAVIKKEFVDGVPPSVKRRAELFDIADSLRELMAKTMFGVRRTSEKAKEGPRIWLRFVPDVPGPAKDA